jgi:hypothetical protein
MTYKECYTDFISDYKLANSNKEKPNPKEQRREKKAKLRNSLDNRDRCSTHVQTPGLQSTMQRTARC